MSEPEAPRAGDAGLVAVDTVGLDADDTLWHSEVHFVAVEDRFRELLGTYDHDHDIDEHLLAVERHNLRFFGYGVKSFTLSMIESAIQLTDGAVSTDDIARIVGWGKEMMHHPIELIDGVAETVETLARTHRVIVCTKGDLLHQEAKFAQSGLAEFVDVVEVMTEKDTETYERILRRNDVEPARFLMVGNSVKSDVLPVLPLGAHAAHIPYGTTWALEREHDGDPEVHGFHVLGSIRDVPPLLERLAAPSLPEVPA